VLNLVVKAGRTLIKEGEGRGGGGKGRSRKGTSVVAISVGSAEVGNNNLPSFLKGHPLEGTNERVIRPKLLATGGQSYWTLSSSSKYFAPASSHI
jgi:hypothetical protein